MTPRLTLPALLAASALSAQSKGREIAPPPRAPAPDVVVSPDHTKLLLMERSASAATVPGELRIAGVRLDPATNTAVTEETWSALIVQPIGRPDPRRMVLPWKARVAHVLWAPDGHRVAFTILEDRGLSLWVGDAYSGVIQMLAGPVLNGVSGTPCQWFPSADRLLCARIPEGRKAQPAGAGMSGQVDHYFTSQLIVVPLSGAHHTVGVPGVHDRLAIAPKGGYILVETVHPPYADRVSFDRLPRRIEIWNAMTGEIIREVHDRALVESASSSEDAAVPGARDFAWRGDRAATLVWVEAQDAGDPSKSASVRDRLFQLDAPFTGTPAPIADLEFRSRGIEWGSEGVAVLNEGWAASRKSQAWVVIPGGTRRKLGEPGAVLGSFFTRLVEGGGRVLLTANAGRSAFAGGDSRLDRIDLVTGRTRRLWQSSGSDREEVVGVIDPEEGRFLTKKQSNYYLRDLRKNGVVQLTRF